MSPEDEKFVNSWQENSKFLQVRFPWGKITESNRSLTVDEDKKFFLLGCDYDAGPEYIPNPTYYFYLWWEEGSIDIYTKREETDLDENKEFIIYYKIYKLVLHQKKKLYSKEFLLNIIKEAFTEFKSTGYPSPCWVEQARGVIVNFDHVKFEGDWSN